MCGSGLGVGELVVAVLDGGGSGAWVVAAWVVAAWVLVDWVLAAWVFAASGRGLVW